MRIFAVVLVVCFLLYHSFAVDPADTSQPLPLKDRIIHLHDSEPELVFKIFHHLSDKDLFGILQLDDTSIRGIIYAYFSVISPERLVKVVNWMRVARRDNHVCADLFSEWIHNVLKSVSSRFNDLQLNIWYLTIDRFIEDVSGDELLHQSLSQYQAWNWDRPDYQITLYDIPFLSNFFSYTSLENDLRLNAVYRYLHFVYDRNAIAWINERYGNRLWKDRTPLPLRCLGLIEATSHNPDKILGVNQLNVELGVGICKWSEGFQWIYDHYGDDISDDAKRLASSKTEYDNTFSKVLRHFDEVTPFEPFDSQELLAIYHGTDSEFSFTAVMAAMESEHLDFVRQLLVPGAVQYSVATTYRFDGDSLLHLYALVSKTDPQIVNAIIDAGVHPNTLTRLGQTPIFYCRDVQCSKALLDAGADLNIVDKGGETPLFAAVRLSDLDQVRLFVEKGADISLGKKSPLELVMFQVSSDLYDMTNRQRANLLEIIDVLNSANDKGKDA